MQCFDKGLRSLLVSSRSCKGDAPKRGTISDETSLSDPSSDLASQGRTDRMRIGLKDILTED